ncbi:MULTISPECIES: ABC transporter ATP-binding protein [Comamonas]|uniref:ABC transporter ATP-binding protein n=1 Tax=Comamonas avium TaxID=2762231 RepID=A0ABR8SDW1_9BURK|nr:MULTISPECIES: ABC transporter ATP-binding protein [Comamonas]MBD7961675.1 ABC transporter ATP-binding protein [Comamonas avium]MBD9401325.1 ABC transporter ATP-binding protein [Comamonas sp. CMM02]
MPLLEVTGLNLFLRGSQGTVQALRHLSFKLERGSALGIIGESGCGKSLTVQTLMGLQPDNATVTGSILWNGQELLGQTERQWQSLRGNRMAMVFQEPMTALNPVHTVGRQVAEPMLYHKGLDRASALKAATALLERVGISNASARVHDFPHQFSGGQRQRITIAMALACEPDVLIADEPTTALDVTVQQQILDLINDVVAERDMALILISHDLGVISQNVDDMLVMYGGQIVESGPTGALFRHMGHPYTRGLMAARPRLDAPRQPSGKPHDLFTIAGTVPALADLPRGCTFAGRCTFTQERCYEDKPARVGIPSFQPHEAQHSSLGVHQVRCLRPEAMRPGNTEAWK